jgi:integrase
MNAKLVNSYVKSLASRDKPYEIYDSELPGFLVRVQPSGTKTYYAAYRLKNRRRNRVRVGTSNLITSTQARRSAKKILLEIASGHDPSRLRPALSGHTLRSFLQDDYGPWVMVNQKSGEQTLKRIEASFSSLMNKKLDYVTPLMIEKWRIHRLNIGKTASTCNRDTSTLKSVFAKAVEWNLIEHNPLSKVQRLKNEATPRVRFLDYDEERRLLDALDAREDSIRATRSHWNKWRKKHSYEKKRVLRRDKFVDHLKPMVLLSLHTGIRRGECFSIEWSDVDLDRGILTIRAEISKSNKARHIPLNATAIETLRTWRGRASKDGYVFSSRTGKRMDNVTAAWTGLLKEAKIENFRWHDLRHHFASRLVMAGVDLNVVRELLGHTDMKTTLVYAHLSSKNLSSAVAVLG